VRLGGALADVDQGGDLPVGQSLRHEQGNLLLTLGPRAGMRAEGRPATYAAGMCGAIYSAA
jgi:hypothetical protein